MAQTYEQLLAKARERQRRYRAEHPEIARNYRTANLERLRAQNKVAQKEWRAKNPKTVQERNAAYRAKHLEADRERCRVRSKKRIPSDIERKLQWQRMNYVSYTDKKLKSARKRAGLSLSSRPEPTVCESCGKPCKLGGRLSFDHCHISGQFRGWLCRACNGGIGLLGDSIEGLMNAVRYLERAAEPVRPF